MAHIYGIYLLVSVSASQLQLQFDPLGNTVCKCILQMDAEIETMQEQRFEEAAESILGKPSAAFATKENMLFLSNSVERVITIRFRNGARMIMGRITSYGVEQN